MMATPSARISAGASQVLMGLDQVMKKAAPLKLWGRVIWLTSRNQPQDAQPGQPYFVVTRMATWLSSTLAPLRFRARSVTPCSRSAITPTSGWASVRTLLAV